MSIELQSKVSSLLSEIASRLDISPSKYKEAVERYNAVSNWITSGEFTGVKDIYFYPQGSFRLGTVIRPLLGGQDADYDIDLVCEMQVNKSEVIPRDLKQLIGNRLKENGKYKEMLDDEGRRCWTLLYAEEDGIGFHLDVLPAAPEQTEFRDSMVQVGVNPEYAELAIAITHKNKDESYKWLASNPNGYAEWFDLKNKPAFELIKSFQQRKLFESNKDIFSHMEDVPNALIKTPLQRSIQILKRHRDIRFLNHSSELDKPISMIITTLAAKLYESEPDVYSTLQNFVDKLDKLTGLLNPGFTLNKNLQDQKILRRNVDGTWYLPNPVNPKENFADRWHENNDKKARTFFQWVRWVKDDIIRILELSDTDKVVKSFETTFGKVSGIAALALGLPVASVPERPPIIRINNPDKPWGE